MLIIANLVNIAQYCTQEDIALQNFMRACQFHCNAEIISWCFHQLLLTLCITLSSFCTKYNSFWISIMSYSIMTSYMMDFQLRFLFGCKISHHSPNCSYPTDCSQHFRLFGLDIIAQILTMSSKFCKYFNGQCGGFKFILGYSLDYLQKIGYFCV